MLALPTPNRLMFVRSHMRACAPHMCTLVRACSHMCAPMCSHIDVVSHVCSYICASMCASVSFSLLNYKAGDQGMKSPTVTNEAA